MVTSVVMGLVLPLRISTRAMSSEAMGAKMLSDLGITEQLESKQTLTLDMSDSTKGEKEDLGPISIREALTLNQ